LTVMVDDAGTGDPVGGCVIGVLRVESREFVSGVVPVRYFQEPLFRERRYLEEAARIVLEAFRRLKVRRGERVQVCRGDVLKLARVRLSREFKVECVRVEGDLQLLVEGAYLEHLASLGVPRGLLTIKSGRERFISLLRWVYEDPERRLRVAKTGWPSWWRRLDGWGRRLACEARLRASGSP